jgi:hypothetical protein
MSSENNRFVKGVSTIDGNCVNPSFTFINNRGSGMYLDSNGINDSGNTTVGLSVDSSLNLELLKTKTIFHNPIKFTSGNFTSGQYLKFDVNGNVISSPLKMSLYGKVNNTLFYDNLGQDVTVSIPSEVSDGIIITSIESSKKNRVSTHQKLNTLTTFKIALDQELIKNIIGVNISNISCIRNYNNLICISYYDIDDDRIKFICSKDIHGDYWFDPVIIDDVSAIGNNSLSLINGIPAIAYIYDDGDEADEIRYVKANDANGLTWGSPITIETTSVDINSEFLSIFLITNYNTPMIFYNDQNGVAKLSKSQDINGTSWGVGTQISNLTNHQIVDVNIVNNIPAVLAISNSNNHLYYVRANNNTATGWPVGATEILINSASFLANHGRSNNTLIVMSSTPYIISSQLTTNTLYISKAQNINGSSWNGLTSLVNTNTTSSYPTVSYDGYKYKLLYNVSTGSPSYKNIITFSDLSVDLSFTTYNNLLTYNLMSEHCVIKNIDDDNETFIFKSNNSLDRLLYYSDLKINWNIQQ